MPVLHPAHWLAQHLQQQNAAAVAEFEERAYDAIHRKNVYRDMQSLREARKTGFQNLQYFTEALEELRVEHGVRLAPMQKQFIEVARLILIPRMFGNELTSAIDTLKARLKIKRLYDVAAVTFPRRSGKTVVQTIIGAVIPIAIENGNVACINLSGRQSQSWLAQTIQTVEKFKNSPKFRYEEIRRDIRETILIINCRGTPCRISSYPGSVDGQSTNLRGMGERLMMLFMDEYQFLPTASFPTILPLLATGAAFLLTSSQSSTPDDAIKRMIFARNADGSDAVYKLNYITACPKCIREKREAFCRDRDLRPPFFQGFQSQALLETLMRPYGEDNFDREMNNIGGKVGITAAFPPELVNLLKDPTFMYNKPNASFDTFFLCVDPAGNGNSDEVVLVVGIDYESKTLTTDYTVVVLGAWRQPKGLTTTGLAHSLKQIIDELRANLDSVRSATAVVIFEANPMKLAASVAETLEKLAPQRTVFLRTARKRASMAGGEYFEEGNITNHQSKVDGAHAINRLLEAKALRIAKHHLCSPATETEESGKDMLITQLLEYCKETRFPKGLNAPYQRWKEFYSGRHKGRGKGRDDMVMALQFALLHHDTYRLDPRSHMTRRT